MEVFIAIGASHALYITLLLITKKKRGFADRILLIFFCVLMLSYLFGYLSYRLEIDSLRLFLWNIGMLLPQLIYLYVKQLMYGQVKIEPSNILHFLPWISSSIYLVILGLNCPTKELLIILSNHNYLSKPILYVFFSFLDLILSPIYAILIFKTIRKYKNKINDNYSYSEDIDLTWIKIIAITTMAFWLVIYAFYISSSYHILTEEDSIKYGLSLSVILVFYIGYYGTKQKSLLFSNYNEITDSSAQIPTQLDSIKIKYQKNGLTIEKAKVLMSTINEYMVQEKPYLNQKLSIQNLSEETQMPTHHISQVLNDVAGQNFFSYTNSYRTEAFIEKIKNNEHQKNTLLGLAYDCGFNSKSSFNRIFKDIKGVSPSEYIKSLS